MNHNSKFLLLFVLFCQGCSQSVVVNTVIPDPLVSKIKNYNIAVKEKEGDIIFLRKLIEGGTDQSYGVHVAKLAGLPHDVLNRAREIQQILEKDDDMMKKIKVKKLQEQMSLGKWG